MSNLEEIVVLLEEADFYDDLHDISEFRDSCMEEVARYQPLGTCSRTFASIEELEEYEKVSLDVSDEQLHQTLDYISGKLYPEQYR